MIADKIRAAKSARLKAPRRVSEAAMEATVPPVAKRPVPRGVKTSERLIAVGASTGGTEAIREFLSGMPADCPGIAIVQHMPENFTRMFAERLNGMCAITVKEAEHNDPILPGDRNAQNDTPPNTDWIAYLKSGDREYPGKVLQDALEAVRRTSLPVPARGAFGARGGGRGPGGAGGPGGSVGAGAGPPAASPNAPAAGRPAGAGSAPAALCTRSTSSPPGRRAGSGGRCAG